MVKKGQDEVEKCLEKEAEGDFIQGSDGGDGEKTTERMDN